VPDLKIKVPDFGVKVPDRKLEVPDLRSGGIRLNLTPVNVAVSEVAYRASSVDRSSLVDRHTCRCRSSREQHIDDHTDAGGMSHLSSLSHRYTAHVHTGRVRTAPCTALHHQTHPVSIVGLYNNGRNRTGPPCSVSRPTAHDPSAGSVTDNDRRRRQTTDDSQQNNTDPLGGPLAIIHVMNGTAAWFPFTEPQNTACNNSNMIDI